jgi:hypothetical protein
MASPATVEPKTNRGGAPRSPLSVVPASFTRAKIRASEVDKANCMTDRVKRMKDRLRSANSVLASDRAWYAAWSANQRLAAVPQIA